MQTKRIGTKWTFKKGRLSWSMTESQTEHSGGLAPHRLICINDRATHAHDRNKTDSTLALLSGLRGKNYTTDCKYPLHITFTSRFDIQYIKDSQIIEQFKQWICYHKK